MNYRSSTRGKPSQKFSRSHTGVDYGMPVGTPAISLAAGTIIRTGSGRYAGGVDLGWDYGKWVVLRDKAGASHFFAHLLSVKSVGTEVPAGGSVGLSGNTGKTAGPHLHWSVYGVLWNRKTLVDPLKYIAGRVKAEKAAALKALKAAAAERARARVRRIAAHLNRANLGRQSTASSNGKPGRNYWWMVQKFGKTRTKLYGRGYIITGVPGKQTRVVEAYLDRISR